MNSRKSAEIPEKTSQERLTFILDEIEAQHQAWTDFILSLTPEQAVEPVDGPWSALDTFILFISGPGRSPFKATTGVRISVGAQIFKDRSTVDVERFLSLIRFENRGKTEELGLEL